MTFKRIAALTALAALLVPAAAGAQSGPLAPSADLTALTNSYFAAISAGDAPAIAAHFSPSFRVILPDGKHLTGEGFLRRTLDHYLVSSPASGTVKINAATVSDPIATESVETASYDYAILGHGQAVEHDFDTHQLTWIRSGGTWLLDEDHITSAVHTIT